MPQIWLTYDELGVFARRDGAAAREAAIAHGWDRRRCHDGLTRVKLPPDATALYLSTCLAEAASARDTADTLRADVMELRPSEPLQAGTIRLLAAA